MIPRQLIHRSGLIHLPGLVLPLLLIAGAAPRLSAQTPPPASPGQPPVSIDALEKQFPPLSGMEKVADHLYLIEGQGGNTAVWVYSTGVLLVDTKFPNNGRKLLALIRTVTDKPVRYIVNTHSHIDHSGSNGEFPAGVQIIDQQNTAARIRAFSARYGGRYDKGLPTRTFKNHQRLLSGADQVDLYYFGPAHTDGDTVVMFKSAHVAHIGDLLKAKTLPTIDPSTGGSGLTFATTLGRVAKLQGIDRVICGHGKQEQVVSWADFLRYTALSQQFLAYEKQQFKQGSTPQQMLAGFKLPPQDQDFSTSGFAFGGLKAVQITFDELKQQNP